MVTRNLFWLTSGMRPDLSRSKLELVYAIREYGF